MSVPAPERDAEPSSVMRNPESSPLVTVYRRAIPVRARRVVAARVAPELRAAMKRRLVASQAISDRLADRRAERISRTFAALSGAEDRRVVTVGNQPYVAHVREFPSPAQAYRENLAKVCEAFDRAGVNYFVLRGAGFSTSAVAVEEGSRRQVTDIIAQLCRDQSGYVLVRQASGRSRRRMRPGASPEARRYAERAEVLRVAWYYTNSAGAGVVGEGYGVDLEFWQADEDKNWIPPRPNRSTDRVSLDSPRVEVPLPRMAQWLPGHESEPATVRSVAECSFTLPEDVTFPVDAVYTWVDGSDPAWLKRRAEAVGEVYHEEAANAARFISRDELRYSLRSLHQYAPWIRNVYLVTDDQVPDWLNTDHPNIKVVSHRDIFTDRTHLPTFNSHAIESQLHHIEGLSEHFLYLNDDVFFGKLTSPHHFFLGNGLTRFFLSKAQIPMGLPSPDDVPVSVAGKNNRAVLEERFSTVITQKMKHVPHALRRSVLYEIEETFADRHGKTAANRFRSLDDLSVTSSLHHYYAYLTQRAVPGNLPYDYFDLSHPFTEARLARLLLQRNRRTFCLNDTVSDERDLESQLAVLVPFLKAYFPLPSPFEK